MINEWHISVIKFIYAKFLKFHFGNLYSCIIAKVKRQDLNVSNSEQYSETVTLANE